MEQEISKKKCVKTVMGPKAVEGREHIRAKHACVCTRSERKQTTSLTHSSLSMGNDGGDGQYIAVYPPGAYTVACPREMHRAVADAFSHFHGVKNSVKKMQDWTLFAKHVLALRRQKLFQVVSSPRGSSRKLSGGGPFLAKAPIALQQRATRGC